MSVELLEIRRRTVANYAGRAEDFWEGTRGHDVEQNIDALLGALGEGSHRILDLGCGPGRDLLTFTERGHEAVGLDATPPFVEMARAHSGCEVLQQDFLALDLRLASFDGIFANASLFHVPSGQLPRVLKELAAALRPAGVLFSSNPRGNNEEGWRGERYGVFHDLASWQRFLGDAGFVEVEHYYRPRGLPRSEQPWLASVWRKYGS
ncbi:MAG: SAM-dependent methyltransferase [Rickettsiales bacterium]|nr:SAM-dependent methyltransferase [Rickettsiales bacterium]